ncbi:MAG: hypothetical protein LAO06_18495 [Acidobacteriia bacterium]|nr:hypothetical protein [Terriglobia bacterium]
MSELSQVESALAFARSLNILLKYARLYGMEHQRTRGQMDTAWSELQRAAAPETGLLLATADGKLLLDGIPIEGQSERSFASLLATSGIASLHFSSGIHAIEFEKFCGAFCSGKPAQLAQQLKDAIGDSSAIRVNEIVFVAQDSNGVAEQLTTRTLGEAAARLVPWLEDPEKLLQLLAAAEGASAGSKLEGDAAPQNAPGGVGGGSPIEFRDEESVLKVLRLLGSMAKVQGSGDDESVLIQELAKETDACGMLRKVLLSLRLEGEDPGANTLGKLAERLAIRFALQQFERGDVKVDAVHELMERMGREINSLRSVLSSREEKLARAGVAVESYADVLDRKFWASIPEQGKKSVLLSADAWCIPARNVRSYIEELLGRGESALADQILRNWLRQLGSSDPQGRRTTTAAISELADLYAKVSPDLLLSALRAVGMRICSEESMELQTQLGAAYVRLTQEAAQHRDYPAVMQSLLTLERLQEYRPRTAQEVRPRVTVENRLRGFISEAVQAPLLPQGLVQVLTRVPLPAAQEIASQFINCDLRSLADRYVELAQAVGKGVIECLTGTLRTGKASEITASAGLLSRLRPETVEQELPRRIADLSRQQQDAVVRVLAAAGAPERAHVLVEMLKHLDPLLLPEALDEVGFAGDATVAGSLMELAAGEGLAKNRPYVRVKAMEALGRLGAVDATSLLAEVLEGRRGLFGKRRSRELQVTAAGALLNVDPERTPWLLKRGGFTSQELAVGALPATSSDWVRQRRYPRVQPARPLSALAITSKGRCAVDVQRLSLGGGLIAVDQRLPRGGEATLEWQLGLYRLRSHVVLRHLGSREIAFEVLDMDLDGRGRLRRIVMDHTPAELDLAAAR